MSRAMTGTPKRRPRRQFTDEFKSSAVRRVLDEGKTVGAAARDLDLSDRDGAARVGKTSPRRPDAGSHRAHHGRARGVGEAAERESHPPGGARHPKKSRGLLREAEPVTFRFIAAERASHNLTILCRCLEVTRSGFYAWQRRPESRHALLDRQLLTLMRAAHAESGRRYGSPRVYEDLVAQGEAVSRKRVVRLMQVDGLRGRMRKRFKQTTMSEHE